VEEAGWTSRVGLGINNLLSRELNSDIEACVSNDVLTAVRALWAEFKETVF